ncbi:hypothetical protein SSX86_003832 [Deinandra increscens subsp. villosa]|uniref:CAAX prenyl protease 2/Lysostaphin resistance protein A-like domain-containing protein n=1 Tax=Deinandra increscens subsp. villosa TaxID=3103831 RepID=A0AAP0H5D7_9ASTR
MKVNLRRKEVSKYTLHTRVSGVEMRATTVHLPQTSSSLTTSPTTSIRTRNPHLLHFTSSITISRASSFKLWCIQNHDNKPSQWQDDFSSLKTTDLLQCDSGSTWSTLGFYIFSLHIPLSFGGLSVVAQLRHQTVLDPNTQVFSLLLIQTLELVSFLSLMEFSNNRVNILSLFETRKERNWFVASVLGVVFLLAFVFLTSFAADKLVGPKDVNNPIFKEILTGGPLSVTGSTLVYCLVTPLLEETVYRGFLLTCLASRMKWETAVMVSSIVFSATHLSVDNFLQLFVIGVVLGCSYCWSGTLISPFVIHSLYNALILVITFIS